LVIGAALFNIFINDLEGNRKLIQLKSADGAEIDRLVSSDGDREIIWLSQKTASI